MCSVHDSLDGTDADLALEKAQLSVWQLLNFFINVYLYFLAWNHFFLSQEKKMRKNKSKVSVRENRVHMPSTQF